MKTTPQDAGVIVRPYQSQDEADVLALLRASLGESSSAERSSRFLHWKHSDSVFGPSMMWVAEADSTIVGLRAFMRWEFRANGRSLHAVRAVDTTTHPAYRGRGIFERLTRHALAAFGSDVDFVFNTPNEKSLQGYLKMGWHVVGVMPIRVRVRHPMRFARGIRSLRDPGASPRTSVRVDAETASSLLTDEDGLLDLLERSTTQDDRIHTPHDLAFLRWRYGSAPGLDYRAVRLERRGRLEGLAFFRVRPRGRLWEATVADVIVPVGRTRSARQLLRRVRQAADVDHLACHFPRGSERARGAALAGYVRATKGILLVANPVRADVELRDPDSWALSLGDLEVF